MTLRRLALVTLTSLLTLGAVPASAFRNVTVGEPSRDFALRTLSGQEVRLSQSLGTKATLVVFWATWSPRSLEALADFQRLLGRYAPKGLQVIAVNAEHESWAEEDAAAIAATVAGLGLTCPAVVDRGLLAFDDYGIQAMPSIILLDGAGRIAELLAGYPGTLREEFERRVLEMLGEAAEHPTADAVASRTYTPRGEAARHYRRGKELLEQGHARDSMRALEQAVAEDPNYAEAYRLLAQAYSSSGRTEEAKRVLRQAQYLTR